MNTEVSIRHASTVNTTTRLQYDIISEDKHTSAWIHKYRRFLGEFWEIKRLKITEISFAHASETNQNIINEPQHDKTNKMTCAPSEDSDQPDQSSLYAHWVAKDPMFIHADSEHSDLNDVLIKASHVEKTEIVLKSVTM